MTPVRALLDLYAEATPDQLRRGREWYPTYQRHCSRIAREHHMPLRRVAATAAITSPDAQLAQNVAWTRAAVKGRGHVAAGRYPNAMRARYAPILRGETTPLRGVGGLKVTAFYRAIMGDTAAVVLDRWALRAVGHDRDTCTPKQYARYAAVYAEAARACGETPRDFQAVVWTVLRERHTRRDGVSVKLTDIHDVREAA